MKSEESDWQEDAVPDIIQELKGEKRRWRVVAQAAEACVFEMNLSRPSSIVIENSEYIFGCAEDEILSEINSLWGFSPEDYLREIIEHFVHPEDVEHTRDRMRRLVHTGNVEFEARLCVFEGRYLWCRLKLILHHDEEDGEILFGLIRNIHKEKKQQMSLPQ